MSMILSVSAAAIITALCAVLLKKSNGEIALLLSLCGVVLIGYMAFSKADPLVEWIDIAAQESIVEDILLVMLKTLGTAVASHITSSVCRDCGENALASGVGFAAKIVTLLLCVPLLDRFMSLIEEILIL